MTSYQVALGLAERLKTTPERISSRAGARWSAPSDSDTDSTNFDQNLFSDHI